MDDFQKAVNYWKKEQQKLYKVKGKILSKFEDGISGFPYKLRREDDVSSSYRRQIDGLITTENNDPCCIINVKINLQKLGIIIAKRTALNLVDKIHARFAVITDGEKYFFFDRADTDAGFKEKDFSEIIENILGFSQEIDSNKQKVCTYFNEIFDIKKLKLRNEDVYFHDNKFTIKYRKECQLIKTLFKFKKLPRFIYRYTSLNTVVEIFQEEKIRMYGIAGMNDSSEVDYIEKILYDNNDKRLLDPEINKLFIMSCSDNEEDNLTQWRLYGNDAKGVCIEFELQEKKSSDFICQKIKYLNEDDPQIGLLKDFVDCVNSTGYNFVFNTLHDWCHFIKSKDWEVESEVRLLYKLSDQKPSGWLLSNGTNIVNPYKEFTLDDFPLKIKKIILGPKCAAPEINQLQLKALIENHPNSSLKDIEISKSKIENYR